jgi:hypothetical protein
MPFSAEPLSPTLPNGDLPPLATNRFPLPACRLRDQLRPLLRFHGDDRRRNRAVLRAR